MKTEADMVVSLKTLCAALVAKRPRTRVNRSRAGYRPDLGDIYFRSGWEANYARYLNYLKKQKLIYKWEFEPDTFYFNEIKRGVRSYLPDFKIWETAGSHPYYVELKGYMDSKSRTKIRRMAKYYPHLRLDVVRATQYNEIKSKMSSIIPNWE